MGSKRTKKGKTGSIVVLNAPKGAEGYGHLALMVRNSKGGWTFISKEGRKKNYWYSPKGRIGELIGAPALPPLIESFNSWQDFRNTQQGGFIYSKNIADYTQAIRLFADATQDSLALLTAENAANSYYHFLLANCADATSGGLMAAGLNSGYDYSMDPRPNIRYRNIMQDNVNEIDTSFHPFDKPILSPKLAELQSEMDKYANDFGALFLLPFPLTPQQEQKKGYDLNAIKVFSAEREDILNTQEELKTDKRNNNYKWYVRGNNPASNSNTPSMPPPFDAELPGTPTVGMPSRGLMNGYNFGDNNFSGMPSATPVSHPAKAKKGAKGGGVSVNIHPNYNISPASRASINVHDEVMAVLTSAIADSKIGTDV